MLVSIISVNGATHLQLMPPIGITRALGPDPQPITWPRMEKPHRLIDDTRAKKDPWAAKKDVPVETAVVMQSKEEPAMDIC